MIVIDKLTKIFANKNKTPKVAVDNLSLEVKGGEIFGLLGPNGAGKTTTIRMLTLQADPTRGKIFYQGQNAQASKEAVKSIIGVVPQHINFDLDLNVRENMELHARLHHIGKKERESRIDELLRYMELEQVSGYGIRQLSGGMKRRLAIARAIIHRPKILFMDEPTVALDPQVRRRIWDLVRNLAKESVTVFLTTHYIEEAENLCDRVAIMSHGKLAALDTPEKFKERLGKFTVEWDDSSGRSYRSFKEKRDAASFMSTIAATGSILLRPTSLEDIFIEITGNKEET